MREGGEIYRALENEAKYAPISSYAAHALQITNPIAPYNYLIQQVLSDTSNGPAGKIVYGSFTTWHNAPTFREYTYGRKYRDND